MSEPVARLQDAIAERYRIERELGAGGMATVYLAHDVRHDRKVAIKVLKPELAAVLGAERFVVEIKTTASLSHPHILPLFDSGTAAGFLYYVMPYIEGETVRDRLNRETQLGVEEAVRIAREVADALDYAHRHGVIHRDIKPENILLHDGRAMVMDFGIALAVSAAAGGRMTETGLSLGTPHYMSPEQATADREITPRSDIYSLASVLYEMLAGQPPHLGGSAQQIIMKIITEPAQPVTLLRRSVPPNVDAALARALEKLPADRFESARAFSDALANPAYAPRATTTAVPRGRPQHGRYRALFFGASAVALLALGLALSGWRTPRPRAPVVANYITFADDQAPRPEAAGFDLSNDGSALVYAGPGQRGRRQLWLKRRGELRAVPIAGTENGSAAFLSPNGEWVAFFANGKLRKAPLNGPSSVELIDVPEGMQWGVWLEDGRIVYTGANYTTYAIPENGGAPQLLLRAGLGGRAPVVLSALPGARGVLYAQCASACRVADLWVLDLRSGEGKELLPGVIQAEYLATGHLLVNEGRGSLGVVPFDLERLEVRGPIVPVIGGLARRVPFRVARDGTLLYVETAPTAGGGLVWVTRDGAVTPVDTALATPILNFDLSPDGRRVTWATVSGQVWVRDLTRGVSSRLTFGDETYYRPSWTPDGQSVVYIDRGGGHVYRQRADGVGARQVLMDSSVATWSEAVYSPDSAWLVLRYSQRTGGRGIVARRSRGDTALHQIVTEQGSAYSPRVSPDGKWIAYGSTESGRSEVYVRPFPDADKGKYQVSIEGGAEPVWAHSGRELFYVDEQLRLIAVELRHATGGLSVGGQRVLFSVESMSREPLHALYAVAPGDQRFLMMRADASGIGSGKLVMIQSWFDMLHTQLKK